MKNFEIETPLKSSDLNGFKGHCHGIVWRGM